MAWPRDDVPVSSRALAQAFLRALSARDGALSVQLRERLRAKLEASTVCLLGSARVGLWRLLVELGTRHPGAEIVLWGYNFFAVPDMARLAGLVPVFVDAASTNGEPDPDAVEKVIGPRTRGLLVSHHFGRPSSMDAWTSLAGRHGLTIIEDCAHAFGARYAGRSVGLFGSGGVFSLSLTKGLTGVAGGVLISNDAELGPRLSAWEAGLPMPEQVGVAGAVVSALLGKVMLSPPTYTAAFHLPNRILSQVGADPIDSLMTETPAPPGDPSDLERGLAPAFAGVALAHLQSVEGETTRRRDIARSIIEAKRWRRLEMPAWETDREATFLNFVVRTPEPSRLRRHLLAAGFDTRMDYLRPALAEETALPMATRLAREGVYLPIRSLYRQKEVVRLIDRLSSFDEG